MKRASKFRSTLLKLARNPKVLAIENNAGLIAGSASMASDLFLTAFDYMKNGAEAFQFHEFGPDQMLTSSGIALVLSSIPLMFSDKHPVMKKLTGGMYAGVGGLMACAGHLDQSPALMFTAATYGIAGVSMVFEDQLNEYGHKLKNAKNKLARAAKTYLEYPVAAAGTILTAGAAFALAAGIQDPDKAMLIPYAALSMIGYSALILTDNDLKADLKELVRRRERKNIVLMKRREQQANRKNIVSLQTANAATIVATTAVSDVLCAASNDDPLHNDTQTKEPMKERPHKKIQNIEHTP